MTKRLWIPPFEDIRPWVPTAIAEEETHSQDRLWKNEPSAGYVVEKRLKEIRLLTKHGRTDPQFLGVAQRLKGCLPRRRCCSGACPECGRLLQRWFARKSKRLIANHLETRHEELVAITIVPPSSIVAPGALNSFCIANFRRRLKYVLTMVGIDLAIGGVDFSFNEDREGKYAPYWSPHMYLITTVANRRKLRQRLRGCFKKRDAIPRPVKITSFHNSARRRSYALKMYFGRRIGYDQMRRCERKVRKCRNTSFDKIRAPDRRRTIALSR